MRSAVFLSTIGILAISLALAACSDDSTPSTASNTGPAATATSAPTATAGGDTFDVTLSGGLEAHWQAGDEGTGISCIVVGGQLEASIYGNLNNATYAIGLRQQTFTPGSYEFPGNADQAIDTRSQISTSSNAQAQWDLASNAGSGTIKLESGSDDPLNATIEGDFADLQGGAAVHVSATFACAVQTGNAFASRPLYGVDATQRDA